MLGWLFLLAAGAVLVRDGLAWSDTHMIAPATFNTLWFDLGSDSQGIFRGAVLNTMPWLWTIVIAPILSLWAAPTLALIGCFLLWRARAGRPPRH